MLRATARIQSNLLCKFINSGSMYLGIYTREEKMCPQDAVFLRDSLESVVSSERLFGKRSFSTASEAHLLVCLISFSADILFAGADGIPCTSATNILQHGRGHLCVDCTDQVLINILALVQTKVFDRLSVKAGDLFLCFAQVVSGVVRAVRAQRIRAKDKPDSGSRYISQRMHNRTHILHKFCAIALAGVALCAKQMMRAQPDHALIPGMRLRTRKPITVARTALMTAVGMNGSTHAVTPAAIELFMSTQNIAVPTT